MGPMPHGVWQGRVHLGVEELRTFLQNHWHVDGQGIKMPPGCADLLPYENYEGTTAPYDRKAQLQNTVRVRANRRRVMECVHHLPGLEKIIAGVNQFMSAVLPSSVSTWL